MVEIFIQLGRQRALALAEIFALFPKAKLSYEGSEILLLEMDLGDEVRAKLNSLGGSPRWGEIIFTENYFRGEPKRDLKIKITDYLGREEAIKDFAFSFLPFWGELKETDFAWARPTGVEIKKNLKKTGRQIRFFTTNKLNAAPAVLQSEKMATAVGCDLVFMPGREEVLIGRTRFLQNVGEWSARDYERPARDAKAGMLPPKVARMMINLATKNKEAILDPFCGSGTILQEATLLGFNHIIGTDASEQQIKNTALNLNQLKTQNSKLKTTLLFSPFSNLPDKLGSKSQSLIVTEPYLGLPHTTDLRQKLLAEEVTKMTDLYYKFIKFLQQILTVGGRACFVAPVWHQRTDQVYLPIDQILGSASDLKIIKIIPEKFVPLLADYLSPRGQILYGRDQQHLWREIWLIEKV